MHQRLCICTTLVQPLGVEGAAEFPSDRI